MKSFKEMDEGEEDCTDFRTSEQRVKQKNNPYNEPTGHYTGRCGNCGSKDLWDDATAYGCNACGKIYFTG